MGPPDSTKIALGVLAATSVAIVSYFLVKKLSYQGKSARRRLSNGDHEELQRKASSIVSSVLEQLPPESFDKGGDGSEEAEQSRKSSVKEGDTQETGGDVGQSSFIVIDNNDNAEIGGEEGQPPKKSDRSSDESSYDVIEDDRFEENVEEEEGDENNDKGRDKNDNGALVPESTRGQTDQESFLDPNDTSMVVIEESDRSGMSKSGSSFYASAEENLGLESSSTKYEDAREEPQKEETEGEESRSEDATLMYEGDGKSVSAEGDVIAQAGDTEKHEEEEASKEIQQGADVIGDQGSVGELASSGDPFGSSSPNVRDKLKIIAVTDAVLGATATTPTDGSPVRESEQAPMELSVSEVTDVLTTCQNKPASVTRDDIEKLVILLQRKNPQLHSTILSCLVRVAAFTQNIKNLRECGCPEIIVTQVGESCEQIKTGGPEAEATLNSLCQVLSNLTLDPETQALVEDAVPSLIDVILQDTAADSLRLSALRPLINLSADTKYHSYYTCAIQELYSLLDTGSQTTRIQSLKVLVNLSLNAAMVPHLLAAKAPQCLLDLLDKPTATDLILRTVTMLANILTAMSEGEMTAASLPTEDKAASPEMLFTAVTGVDRVETLRSKVFRLTRHDNEDVCFQASKLYKCLTESTE